MEGWRDELERHRNDPDAHPAARRAGLEAFDRRRAELDADIWGAVRGLRTDVDLLKSWRAFVVGGLSVLLVEVTVFGGVLLAFVIR